ncbi:UvrD-helicase domain-containing protein [Alkalimonas amylolytica]|uniref:DNA helicase-2 / ATP-dependent DNA helicase PcrA n=1 Tax=Alkalimonas amylolytica TaxID=152573 RepID=A0A1H4DVQ5_ALKAM|nr:UvrD-helicase domain-containing protein [Alkalimonas amylolytica]SEA76844.1 DNA helicase-2 / ATP-dependent DNA helicase PcrA [Alkalimonas amylolytica]
MSSRANKPDTQADIELRHCIASKPPKSFIMKAGAGSGKTTSLIKGLSAVIQIHGDNLRRTRQRVACITYTDIAAGEIWRDVGSDPLVHVSTIHSFMWLLAKPFQKDIRDWVSARITEKIRGIEEKQASYGPRVQQRTKDKDARDIVRLRRQLERISDVKTFRYGTGSKYGKGILGHDDILKLGTYLICERPLFQTLLARQFPFVFVDESQDTTAEVVDALKLAQRDSGAPFCLGFFGDPMQRIYVTGSGLVEPESDWVDIPKPENYRCSLKVLSLANAIRRDGDDLVQVPGKRLNKEGIITSTPEGSAHLFILPADNSRDVNLSLVRQWMATNTGDDLWCPGSDDQNRVKLLVIVHQMAAKRLGFGELYSALNSKAPSAFKDGFLDGTAWPLSPFMKFLVPIAIANHSGHQLEVMRLLRTYSPQLEDAAVAAAKISDRLKSLGKLVASITAGVFGESNTTIGDLLRLVYNTELLLLDPRLTSYLDPSAVIEVQETPVQDENDEDEQEEDESEKEFMAMQAFLSCPANQLLAYQNYIMERSPFWTQQGIKGAEFERVLVVLDDAESTHSQFSYEKYLRLKEPSDRDIENLKAGLETTIDRTRRLFYVSCTRALKDLAVILFTENPSRAEPVLRQLNLFESDSIHTLSALQE